MYRAVYDEKKKVPYAKRKKRSLLLSVGDQNYDQTYLLHVD